MKPPRFAACAFIFRNLSNRHTYHRRSDRGRTRRPLRLAPQAICNRPPFPASPPKVGSARPLPTAGAARPASCPRAAPRPAFCAIGASPNCSYFARPTRPCRRTCSARPDAAVRAAQDGSARSRERGKGALCLQPAGAAAGRGASGIPPSRSPRPRRRRALFKHCASTPAFAVC